ncbi:MAG: hypothetical protein K1060chlam2_00720, partial [Chlamydiae bacterium]|nr:hypothetical protein [Chlamydiota bacterium]
EGWSTGAKWNNDSYQKSFDVSEFINDIDPQSLRDLVANSQPVSSNGSGWMDSLLSGEGEVQVIDGVKSEAELKASYLKNPLKWMRLGIEERSAKAVVMADAGIHALPLENAGLKEETFPIIQSFERRSPAYISWMLRTVNMESKSDEFKVYQYIYCRKNGIEPVRFAITKKIITKHLKDSDSELLKLFEADFEQHPHYFFGQSKEIQEKLHFSEDSYLVSKPSIEKMKAVSPDDIATMDFHLFLYWVRYNERTGWEGVPSETRTAAVTRIVCYQKHAIEREEAFVNLDDISFINEPTIAEIKMLSPSQVLMYSLIREKSGDAFTTKISSEEKKEAYREKLGD